MREKNRSGRGARRRSGGDEGADLFAKQLSEVVQQAFAATGGEVGAGEAIVLPASPVEDRGDLPPVATPDAPAEAVGPPLDQPPVINFQPPLDPLPARMLNEFVYCPRLFYYEHVEGVFVESADTVKGKVLHKRVDKGSGAMPAGRVGVSPAAAGVSPDTSAPSDAEEGGDQPAASTEALTLANSFSSSALSAVL